MNYDLGTPTGTPEQEELVLQAVEPAVFRAKASGDVFVVLRRDAGGSTSTSVSVQQLQAVADKLLVEALPLMLLPPVPAAPKGTPASLQHEVSSRLVAAWFDYVGRHPHSTHKSLLPFWDVFNGARSMQQLLQAGFKIKGRVPSGLRAYDPDPRPAPKDGAVAGGKRRLLGFFGGAPEAADRKRRVAKQKACRSRRPPPDMKSPVDVMLHLLRKRIVEVHLMLDGREEEQVAAAAAASCAAATIGDAIACFGRLLGSVQGLGDGYNQVSCQLYQDAPEWFSVSCRSPGGSPLIAESPRCRSPFPAPPVEAPSPAEPSPTEPSPEEPSPAAQPTPADGAFPSALAPLVVPGAPPVPPPRRLPPSASLCRPPTDPTDVMLWLSSRVAQGFMKAAEACRSLSTACAPIASSLAMAQGLLLQEEDLRHRCERRVNSRHDALLDADEDIADSIKENPGSACWFLHQIGGCSGPEDLVKTVEDVTEIERDVVEAESHRGSAMVQRALCDTARSFVVSMAAAEAEVEAAWAGVAELLHEDRELTTIAASDLSFCGMSCPRSPTDAQLRPAASTPSARGRLSPLAGTPPVSPPAGAVASTGVHSTPPVARRKTPPRDDGGAAEPEARPPPPSPPEPAAQRRADPAAAADGQDVRQPDSRPPEQRAAEAGRLGSDLDGSLPRTVSAAPQHTLAAAGATA
eukprot:TRINITY_DN10753_c0_g1_i1.p1 TRINITY_DN10753_c0_g1~~TRINITY_DN10753_c0_g1_i1.p1  ORF type:complete len:690 (+),score=249.80 TRINITY_DN10753_c0_g1_i1:107-2176(+)